MTKVTEFEGSPGLEALQAAVGGYIEHVPNFGEFDGRPCDVYVDEEGLLKGKPINREMTLRWRKQLEETGRPYDRSMATLFGDATVVYGGE